MRFYSKANIDLYLFSILYPVIRTALIQVLLTSCMAYLSLRFTITVLLSKLLTKVIVIIFLLEKLNLKLK